MFIDDDFTDSRTISTLFPVLTMLIFSTLGILSSYSHMPRTDITRKYSMLMIYIYFIALVFSLSYPLQSRDEYVKIILPLLLFYIMCSISLYVKNDQIVVWAISIIVILLGFNYFSGYYVNLFGTVNSTTASYHVLYFLPFLLCHRNKILRIVFMAFIAVIVMVSLKRGGLVAVFAAIAVYLYISQFKLKGRHLTVWGAFATISVIIGVFYLFSIINERVVDDQLLIRIDAASQTGGSGRLDVYKGYLDFIGNDNIGNLIIGHGWWGSMRDSRVGVTCHNDFLEAFVDFGIIGFLLYVAFVISLIKHCSKMIKVKHEYAPAMGAGIAMFLVNSMVAHILIYPKYQLIIALFWGFMVSATRKMIIKDKIDYENRTVNVSRGM
jgi:O-antigen ligase